MRNKFTIRYLPAAEEDLLSIYDWIEKDDISKAERYVEELDKRIGSLAQNPFPGRIPRLARLRDLRYRVLIVDKYLVFYKIRVRVVLIYRVIHGSRQLDDIL